MAPYSKISNISKATLSPPKSAAQVSSEEKRYERLVNTKLMQHETPVVGVTSTI